ncbi:MAG: glycosyltransferase family 39 protein [Bryobacteraceae bacterium]
MSTSSAVAQNRRQYASCLIQAFDSRHAIYFLIGFGVLVRLIPLALVGGKFLAHENPSYDVMAGQLLRNEHFYTYWPPGLPYYLAFFHALFGYGMLVARASILAVYVAFSFALYGLLKELASRRAGNLAVLAFAFYPSYIRYAFDPSTEYLTATCLLVIVYCTILILRKPSVWLAAFLGISLGAVALVRANSLALAIIIPAYLVFRTRRWSLATASLVITSIMVSVWLWKVSNMAGRFVFINDSNEENIVFSNHPATPLYLTCRDCPTYGALPARFLELEHEIDYKPPLEQQRQLRQTTLRFILTRPDLFALRTLNRVRAYFRFPIHYADPLVRHSNTGRSMRQWLGGAITVLEAAFFWPIMAIAIISCFNLPSLRIESSALFTTLGVASVYALPCWLTWSEPRYAFPLIPLFAVFSFALLDALLTRPWRQVFAPILNSTSRKKAMLGTVSIFFGIQIEWIVLIVSANAWHDKWAHVTSFPYAQ